MFGALEHRVSVGDVANVGVSLDCGVAQLALGGFESFGAVVLISTADQDC